MIAEDGLLIHSLDNKGPCECKKIQIWVIISILTRKHKRKKARWNNYPLPMLLPESALWTFNLELCLYET